MNQARSDWERFVYSHYEGDSIAMQAAYSVLKRADSMASEFHLDVTMLDEQKLSRIVGSIGGSRNQSAETAIKILRKYNSWRIDNGLQVSGAIQTVSTDVSDFIRASMVCSPAHLSKTLDMVFNSASDRSSDSIYKVFLWLCFSGIKDVDTLYVKTTDVDFVKMRVLFCGRSYKIYKQSEEDFKVLVFSDKLSEKSTRYGEIITRTFERAQGDILLRGKKRVGGDIGASSLKQTIRPLISRRFQSAYESGKIKNGIPSKLTAERTYRSGMFYRIYTSTRYGAIPDFISIANDEYDTNIMKGKTYTVDKKSTIDRMAKEIEEDYKSWRSAFGL